jgi:hypothetical protein
MCHSSQNHFCNGYLSFVANRLEGGLESLWSVRLAIGIKLIDPTLINNLQTFESIEAMLEDHRERMKYTIPEFEDEY